ncbi:hypothetical protein GCM10010435_39100 [Winogradskya consettensis]|uniref:Antitoxin SocA-like Panacea domain-containing protein n=1 Tax=Winogradskya consettensis TaxID=113560 RepID=A0A919T560_9ACTN|nr:type II toxin-antitoxin system antitoxin SocA domain-containing protein [Actinoplanes consettensis]GIM84707.1 hypothetical protein Aco04nite_92690 [Actinoplanes consettensis]
MPEANDVAAVISSRLGRPWLDAMSLQKFLYYVQAWHLAIKGKPLFEGRFEAWPEGPVLPEVLHARQPRIARRAIRREAAQVDLDDEIISLIELVVRTYGSLGDDELAALTRVEMPWREARGNLPEFAPSTTLISEDSMADFFRNHRRLQGHEAGYLSIVGIHARAYYTPEPMDVDSVLASLGPEFDDPGDDRWPSANLDFNGEFYRPDDRKEDRRPTDAGA